MGGICKHCNAEISISSGSTSNLRRHFFKKHPTIPVERFHREANSERLLIPAIDIQVPQSCNETRTSDSPPEKESESSYVFANPADHYQKFLRAVPRLNNLKTVNFDKTRMVHIQLLKMICSGGLSFHIVEDDEFVKFVKMLCPDFFIPPRKFLCNDLLSFLCSALYEEIISLFVKAPAVCLAIEGWTDVNGANFYGISAHFFEKNLNLKTVFLECYLFPKKCKIVDIAAWILAVAKKFKIDEKICAVMTDNGENIVKAVCNLNLPHVPCFAHNFNSVIREGIKHSINPTLERVRFVIEFFSQSYPAEAKLNEAQKRFNVDVKLKKDVPNRWNSIYDMLDRVLQNKEPITSVFGELNFEIGILDSDWATMEESLRILKIFDEVTVEITSENSLSLSKTSILILGIIKYVQSTLLGATSREGKKLGKVLLENMNKKFENWEGNELIAESIFLDPRFKKRGFGQEEKFLEVKKNISEKIKENDVSNMESEVDKSLPNASTSSSVWDEFDASVSRHQAAKLSKGVELDKYCSEDLLDRNLDPLTWWEQKKKIYPNLYNLVLKRLCIPASSVPCDALFSKVGLDRVQRRSRLTSSKLNEMLFVGCNKSLARFNNSL